MTLIGPPSAIAPQISGVSSGLPEPRALQRPDQKITELTKKDATRNDASGQMPREDTPAPLRPNRSNSAQDAAPPPTILQLKIDEMLREQADQLKETADEPEQRPDRDETGPRAIASDPSVSREPSPHNDESAPEPQVEMDAQQPSAPEAEPAQTEGDEPRDRPRNAE